MAKIESSKLTSEDLFQRLLKHLAIKLDADGIDMLNDALEALHAELAEMALTIRRLS